MFFAFSSKVLPYWFSTAPSTYIIIPRTYPIVFRVKGIERMAAPMTVLTMVTEVKKKSGCWQMYLLYCLRLRW